VCGRKREKRGRKPEFACRILLGKDGGGGFLCGWDTVVIPIEEGSDLDRPEAMCNECRERVNEAAAGESPVVCRRPGFRMRWCA
jgi:hypothetical protein